MSREIQTGVNCTLPSFVSILNAAMAPFLTSPYSTGALNLGCFGPQNGVNTQRVLLASSQLASDPQIPASAKSTISLQISGVRYTGVRWSSPPSDSVSINYMRHSLLASTMYSLLF